VCDDLGTYGGAVMGGVTCANHSQQLHESGSEVDYSNCTNFTLFLIYEFLRILKSHTILSNKIRFGSASDS